MVRFHGRSKRGASLALVAACAAGLMVLIFGCFQIAMLFGGARDVRNSIDACALNVSRRSFELRVTPTDDFSDCADSSGGISLANVNRVWAKALLEAANQEEMKNENADTGTSNTNIDLARQNAQQINDGLYGTLTDGRNLAPFFSDLAENRSIALPGSSSSMVPCTEDSWQSAGIDRGSESNIGFRFQQLPPGANVSLPSTVINGNPVIKGYTPIDIGGRKFYFVSFRANEMPHLVSDSYFEQNRTDKKGVSGIANTIPNAFSVQGRTTGSATLAATAYAAANPQRGFMLTIPHAFVMIRFSNVARWFVNGKKVNETTYGMAPETQWGAKQVPLECGGKLNGYASLGNEYQVGSVWDALIKLPGSIDPALTRLLQRVKEIDPLFSEDELRFLLQKQPLKKSLTTYIIYPLYQTSDSIWPMMKIRIAPLGEQKSSWLMPNNRADGLQRKLLTQEGSKDNPNSDWQMIIGGSNCTPGEHYTITKAQIDWQAGTGYRQNLGELIVNHSTDCYFNAN